jgi:hypothetical protein
MLTGVWRKQGLVRTESKACPELVKGDPYGSNPPSARVACVWHDKK